ncbi:MAG: hypothetical protein AAGB18_07880, partial [Pseudomonadota bacterium]
MSFGQQPWQARKRALDAAALNAEWETPDGEIGKVIRQLRRRGEAARRRAGVVSLGLFIVILAGLAFYLGLPFWQQYVDGRRLTLEETTASIKASETRLDAETAELRAQLIGALKDAPQPVPKLTGMENNNYLAALQLSGGNVLLVGTGADIHLWDPESELPPLPVVKLPGFEGHEAAIELSDGRVLIAGANKTLLIWDPAGGGQPQQIPDTPGPEDATFFTALQLKDGRVMVAGNQTIVLWDPESDGPPTMLREGSSLETSIFRMAQLTDGRVLAVGEDNLILLIDPIDFTGRLISTNPPQEGVTTYWTVLEMVDGRVLLAGDNSGLQIWDP